jgi:hypothetical protein
VMLAPRLAEPLNLTLPAVGWPLALPAVLAAAAVIGSALPVVRALRGVTLIESLRAE